MKNEHRPGLLPDSPEFSTTVDSEPAPPPKSRRGFASLSPERHREIAQKGGRTAQANGLAHHFTPEEARTAGRQGGFAVSADRAHMARIGRKGGAKNIGKRRSARVDTTALDELSPLPTTNP